MGWLDDGGPGKAGRPQCDYLFTNGNYGIDLGYVWHQSWSTISNRQIIISAYVTSWSGIQYSAARLHMWALGVCHKRRHDKTNLHIPFYRAFLYFDRFDFCYIIIVFHADRLDLMTHSARLRLCRCWFCGMRPFLPPFLFRFEFPNVSITFWALLSLHVHVDTHPD